jgi:N4-(beta-N-acetylglucosaminyl)-L-asparaginase
MKINVTRRDFFRSSAVAGLGARLLGALSPTAFAQAKGSRPLIVSSANGLRATAKAMEMIRAGKDTLDAVVAGVAIVEDDPKDMSVGYGGLPNEDGVVELDASVMHGPTKRAGAVASIQRIKNPAQVAKLVMERTDHVLLVGPGALRFALAQGFKEMDLLTDEARIVWLRWKERMSQDDSWGPGLASPDGPPAQSRLLNGDPVRACLMFAVQAEGSAIRTVEGLATGDDLGPVQQAFIAHHGVQCGFCTPGFLVTVTAALEENPHPDADQAREIVGGNLCRCTGYQNIVAAIRDAASAMKGASA